MAKINRTCVCTFICGIGIWQILNVFISYYCRRQTAEEREQERQAATKYFLSMQLGSLPPPPPPPPNAHPHPTLSGLDATTKDEPASISALESLRPWTSAPVHNTA